jgi:hypothetical protein
MLAGEGLLTDSISEKLCERWRLWVFFAAVFPSSASSFPSFAAVDDDDTTLAINCEMLMNKKENKKGKKRDNEDILPKK